MQTFKNKLVQEYCNIIGNIPLIFTDSDITFHGSQKPGEFFKAWELIDTYVTQNNLTHISFLEIGAFKGLWALALKCYSDYKNISISYTTITLMSHNIENNSLLDVKRYYELSDIKFTLIDGSSHDISSIEQLTNPNYNIVFIDGDHSYEAVCKDIKLYKQLTTDILMFHDIRRNSVFDAIIDSDIILHESICTYNTHMGIGLSYIKEIDNEK
jgi:hypothetical protein